MRANLDPDGTTSPAVKLFLTGTRQGCADELICQLKQLRLRVASRAALTQHATLAAAAREDTGMPRSITRAHELSRGMLWSTTKCSGM